jgi:hypothetical protein
VAAWYCLVDAVAMGGAAPLMQGSGWILGRLKGRMITSRAVEESHNVFIQSENDTI